MALPRRYGVLAGLALAGAFSACGTSDLEYGATAQPIIGGERAGDEFAGVVSLLAGDGPERAGCTATLIAPNVVVTAMHCVSYFDSDSDVACNDDGSLASEPPAGLFGATAEPSTVEVHTGAVFEADASAFGVQLFGSGSTHICRHDIAAVVLDRELSGPVVAVRVERGIERGDTVQVVGFGDNGTPEVSLFERGNVRVTDVGSASGETAQGIAAPQTFVVGEGPCLGDSGGPAFSEETGALIGVYSIAAGASCDATGVRNVYTMTAPFESLLREAVQTGGHILRVEDESTTESPDDAGASDPQTTALPPGSGSRRESSPTCSARIPGRHTPFGWHWLVVAMLLRMALTSRAHLPHRSLRRCRCYSRASLPR